ncbi:MAG: hypothetical protein M3P40_02365 [Actinomycetota bacterium]|nr:hypothetical protein [Actinomycetota bacterium]
MDGDQRETLAVDRKRHDELDSPVDATRDAAAGEARWLCAGPLAGGGVRHDERRHEIALPYAATIAGGHDTVIGIDEFDAVQVRPCPQEHEQLLHSCRRAPDVSLGYLILDPAGVPAMHVQPLVDQSLEEGVGGVALVPDADDHDREEHDRGQADSEGQAHLLPLIDDPDYGFKFVARGAQAATARADPSLLGCFYQRG